MVLPEYDGRIPKHRLLTVVNEAAEKRREAKLYIDLVTSSLSRQGETEIKPNSGFDELLRAASAINRRVDGIVFATDTLARMSDGSSWEQFVDTMASIPIETATAPEQSPAP